MFVVYEYLSKLGVKFDNINFIKGRMPRLIYFGNVIGVYIFGSFLLVIFERYTGRLPTFIIAVYPFIVPLLLVSYIFYVSVKRFHDLDMTGLWALMILVPIINVFALLYLIFFKGTEGENMYGVDPFPPRRLDS